MRTSRFRRPLQIFTFFRKEATDVLHQPRLLLTLVIGPFLVMALFGLGYRDSPSRLRTIFVAPAESPLLEQVPQYADQIDQYVKYAGVTTDPNEANQKLLDGDVDLIVSFPEQPLATVLGGKQADIQVIHTRLDPIEQTAIYFASRISVDQINGQILAGLVSGGQELARPAGELVQEASAAAQQLNADLEAGDPEATQASIDRLDDLTSAVAVALHASTALSSGLGGEGAADAQAASAGASDAADEMVGLVATLRPDTSPDTMATTTARIDEILSGVTANYAEFTNVDPSVLVRPFRAQVQLAVPDVNNVSDWYAPAAVILMLQQFGVAFGALSFVREKRLGIVDVFRVAPVGATETLIGKYLAYTLVGGAIGAVLTSLVVGALGVPIQASIGEVAIVMVLSLVASIGLGFVISLASGSDAQAVQYTMILLLASLFFSGFFLSLGQLKGPATYVGWLLPVTYGMRLLRDVMLRGAPLDIDLVLGLSAYCVVTFGLALLGTRRRMSVAR